MLGWGKISYDDDILPSFDMSVDISVEIGWKTEKMCPLSTSMSVSISMSGRGKLEDMERYYVSWRQWALLVPLVLRSAGLISSSFVRS